MDAPEDAARHGAGAERGVEGREVRGCACCAIGADEGIHRTIGHADMPSASHRLHLLRTRVQAGDDVLVAPPGTVAQAERARVPGIARDVELVDRAAARRGAGEIAPIAVLVDAVAADLGTNRAPGGAGRIETVAVLVDAIATHFRARRAGRRTGDVRAVAVLVETVAADLGRGDGNGERAHERAIDTGPNAGHRAARRSCGKHAGRVVAGVAFTRGARGAAVVGGAIAVFVDAVAADFCGRRASGGAIEIASAAVLVDAIATAVVTAGARRTIGVVAVGIEGEDVARGDRVAVRSDDEVRRIAVAVAICVTPVDGVIAVGIGSRIGIRLGRLAAERVQHHALPDPGGPADIVRVVRAALGAADLVADLAGRAVHLGPHRIRRSRVRLPCGIVGRERRGIEIAAEETRCRDEKCEDVLHSITVLV